MIRRMSLGPGVRIGAFEVIAKLGEGGMGQVFRARDTVTDTLAAVLACDIEWHRLPRPRPRPCGAC